MQLTTNSIFYFEKTLSKRVPKENPQQQFLGEYALATYLGLSFI